jgi:hypothetical protein
MATRIEDNTRLFTHVSESPPDKSLSEIAPAPTHLSAEDTHLNGWRWASERYDDGLGNVKQARKWCTLNPRGRKLDVLTLLLQLDKTDISITLALPAPYEESSLFWANDSNRSHVMRTVEKVMNSLNLSACLDVPTLPEYAMQGDEDNEERLMNVANTLAKRLKLNKISVAGQEYPYDLVFRRATVKEEDVITGYRYANYQTLVRTVRQNSYLRSRQLEFLAHGERRGSEMTGQDEEKSRMGANRDSR